MFIILFKFVMLKICIYNPINSFFLLSIHQLWPYCCGRDGVRVDFWREGKWSELYYRFHTRKFWKHCTANRWLYITASIVNWFCDVTNEDCVFFAIFTHKKLFTRIGLSFFRTNYIPNMPFHKRAKNAFFFFLIRLILFLFY